MSLNSTLFTQISVDSNIFLNLSILDSTTTTLVPAGNSSCLPALILIPYIQKTILWTSYNSWRNAYHKAQVLPINTMPEHIDYLRLFVTPGGRSLSYTNHQVVHLVQLLGLMENVGSGKREKYYSHAGSEWKESNSSVLASTHFPSMSSDCLSETTPREHIWVTLVAWSVENKFKNYLSWHFLNWPLQYTFFFHFNSWIYQDLIFFICKMGPIIILWILWVLTLYIYTHVHTCMSTHMYVYVFLYTYIFD